MVNRTKEKQISIRLSEEELEKLKANIEISGLNQRDYIAGCIVNDSKNIFLEKDIDMANARIRELEYSLQEICKNNNTKYENLKNKYDELMETALSIKNQAEEYKAKVEEKEQNYDKLLNVAINLKTKLKKEVEDKNKDVEYSEQALKILIINIFIFLLYVVIISVIAVIRHFDIFALAYIPIPIFFVWNIIVIYRIIKYFSDEE